MKMRTAVSYQAVVLMAAAIVAATGGQVSAETVATGDGLLSLNLDAARGVAREATIAGIAARGRGGTEMVDHTPAPPADEQALAEHLRGLYLPEGAPDEMHTVDQADDGPVREVSLGWLSGDRYLWRIELARALAQDEQITVYLDADHDPATGRQDFEGVELMLQVGPTSQRVIYHMADGRGAVGRRLHARVDGPVIHLTCDYPLKATVEGVSCRVCVAAPDGRTPMTEVAVPLAHAVSVTLAPQGRPTAEPAVIRWERRSADGALTLAEQIEPRERYLSWKASVRNQGEQRRWLDLSLALPIGFEGEWSFFDSFNLRPHVSPAADTVYSASSAVFPLMCVYADGGLAIALNPWTLFSELHAGVRVSDEAKSSLLGSRIVVDPGASEEMEFVLFSFDGSLGWRGAISKYWELFPEAFERATDIDPRFHMTSSGGLYWSFPDPEAPEFSPDLIRRMHAGWAWGYAPAPRPGEWAVTERSVGEWTRSHGTVKKSLSAERLPEVREYVREKVDGDKAHVAVAYYMHLSERVRRLPARGDPDDRRELPATRLRLRLGLRLHPAPRPQRARLARPVLRERPGIRLRGHRLRHANEHRSRAARQGIPDGDGHQPEAPDAGRERGAHRYRADRAPPHRQSRLPGALPAPAAARRAEDDGLVAQLRAEVLQVDPVGRA
jgi:hypothetical protein